MRVVADVHLAADVVQDVFLAVWRGQAGLFDPKRGSARAWLLQVTHHKAVDTVRRHQRHASRNAGPDLFEGIASSSDVEGNAWDSQRRTQLLAALAHLSDDRRVVVELAYFGCYTQAEIAKLTSTPLGTVKSRTRTALRQLRQNLDLAAIAAADGLTRDRSRDASVCARAPDTLGELPA